MIVLRIVGRQSDWTNVAWLERKATVGKRRKRNAIPVAAGSVLESARVRSRPDSRGAKIEKEKKVGSARRKEIEGRRANR